jgi:hypothetical protein
MNAKQLTVFLAVASSLFGTLPAIAQSQPVGPVPTPTTSSPADTVRNIQVSAEAIKQPTRKADDLNTITDSIQLSGKKSSDTVQPSEIFTNSDKPPFKFNAPIQRF